MNNLVQKGWAFDPIDDVQIGLVEQPKPQEAVVNSVTPQHSQIVHTSTVPPEQRVTQSDTELHVGMEIPTHTGKAIYRWARDQQWPGGTELEPPSEYHCTLMYTPEGHHEHKDAWWIEHMDKAHAHVKTVDSFEASDKGYAYVLKLDAPEIEEHANNLQGRAESVGLPITHFPGGYQPHITVGYGPTPAKGIEPPKLELILGPSSVSPPREDKISSAPPEPLNYRKGTIEHHCGNCLMMNKGHCWGYGNKAVKSDAVCDEWTQEKTSNDGAQVLDQLSLTNVAHNLHYRFEKGTDTHDIVDYAQRLLKMIGYDPDQMNTQAAIQTWQQLYPQDHLQSSTAELPRTSADYPPPGGTHKCPQCDQGMISNGWTGWTGVDPEGVAAADRSWHCPGCNLDFHPAEQRPIVRTATNHLYHWLDRPELSKWMDETHTGPGATFLTENPELEDGNDIPLHDNPVRITIDPGQLDSHLFDGEYGMWKGNHLYRGAIPTSAILGIDRRERPDWDNMNVIPTPDTDPRTLSDDERHHNDVSFGNDTRMLARIEV